MPAPARRFGRPDPRERLLAVAGVLLVQVGLGLALLSGLRVGMIPPPQELVSRLVQVTLPPPPPPIVPKPVQRPKPAPKHAAAAPPPRQANPGGTKGPAKHGKVLVKTPLPAPAAAPAGGGGGTGASQGNGSGGGNGTGGIGADGGGTDSEKIAGDFYDSDYPPDLARAGIGGRVTATIEIGVNGRVTSCRISRSSGNAELDSLTCRIIEQRYRFRPATDGSGRPVPDEADVDQEWGPAR